MFKNYLKVAARYLLRYKGYSFINIFGLAVGVASCILVMVFVRSELSYDRFHSKSDRLFKVWQLERTDNKEFVGTVTGLPIASAIQTTFPEVNAATRVYDFTTLVKNKNRSFNETICMVDTSFFSMFDFSIRNTLNKNPLASPTALLITRNMEKKYFGDSSGVGKTLELQLGDTKMIFVVSGILDQSPEESSIKFEFIIPFQNAKYLFRPRMLQSWFNVFAETYILIRPGADAKALENKFPDMLKQQLGQDYGKEVFELHLLPIASIHLNTKLPAAYVPTSDPKYSFILSTIGIVILLVACINFITLSVGRSATRALEVGVRKTLGADRYQLMKQFWGEALLITLLSFVAGIAIAVLLLGPFNVLIDRHMAIHPDLMFGLFCIALIAIVALAAGIYPAVILSGFNPIEVLKGKMSSEGMSSGLLRKGLIAGQFTVSVTMITCTIVIGRQMHYLSQKNLGYNKEEVVTIPIGKKRVEGYKIANRLKSQLNKHPEIADEASSVYSFAETPWATLGFSDNRKTYHSFQFNEVDQYFVNAMKIRLIAGRNFKSDHPSDSINSILVNETLVREYGIHDPIGKRFGKYSQEIIGVMEDFNFESLHTPIKPVVFALNADTMFNQSDDISYANEPLPVVSVRLKPGNIAASMKILEQCWRTIEPDQEFQFHFLDDAIAAAYKQEEKSSLLVRIAALLSVFIACIGLFGLAIITVQRRTKEIGIRKVMGANPFQLVQLLSKDFVILVGFAALLSVPIAFWLMNHWLRDFAYQTSLSWWIFVVSAVAAIGVAWMTVGFQAFRAAVRNPVSSLRTD